MDTSTKKINNDSINFVAIDLETATIERTSICQIGITEVIGGVPQQPKSWLVRPEGNRYDQMNIDIHGISPPLEKNITLPGDGCQPGACEIYGDVHYNGLQPGRRGRR